MSQLGFAKKIYLSATICLIANLGIFAAVYLEITDIVSINKEIQVSQLSISRYGQLINLMVDMETGIRGYMLGGDTAYLDPYNKGEESFNIFAEETRALLPARSHATLEKILTLKTNWIEQGAIVEMLARRKFDAKMIQIAEFEQIFKTSPGNGIMMEIRKEVTAATAEEEQRLKKMAALSEASVRQILILSGCACLMMILGFGGVGFIARQVINSLYSLIERLISVSGLLSSASEELSDSSKSLSDDCERQIDAVATTSEFVQQVNKALASSAEDSTRSSRLASDSESNVRSGQGFVNQMRGSIDEIKKTNDSVIEYMRSNASEMERVSRLIRDIGEKTKVINEIVLQTRLLSFNASVEASRAGEHGKGFSVVAEEVGLLAASSGRAAVEISALVSDSAAQVQNSVAESKRQLANLAQRTESSIESGRRLADQCFQGLERAVDVSVQVNEMMESIAGAIDEQSGNLRRVEDNVRQIETITGAHRKSAAQANDSADGLMQQSRELADIVHILKRQVG